MYDGNAHKSDKIDQKKYDNDTKINQNIFQWRMGVEKERSWFRVYDFLVPAWYGVFWNVKHYLYVMRWLVRPYIENTFQMYLLWMDEWISNQFIWYWNVDQKYRLCYGNIIFVIVCLSFVETLRIKITIHKRSQTKSLKN